MIFDNDATDSEGLAEQDVEYRVNGGGGGTIDSSGGAGPACNLPEGAARTPPFDCVFYPLSPTLPQGPYSPPPGQTSPWEVTFRVNGVEYVGPAEVKSPNSTVVLLGSGSPTDPYRILLVGSV